MDPKTSPKNGPKMMTFVFVYTYKEPVFRAFFWDCFSSLLSFDDRWNLVSMQEFSVWRWHSFMESECVGDKTVVRINMDEMCCKV